MGVFRSTNPTVFDDVDGIIVNESAPSPNIRGVAANIAILVGQFQRGSENLTEVGSIGEFHELYGKDASFSGNIALKNKKFGRLRIIRAIASDAAKATKAFASGGVDRITFTAKHKGAYGNNIKVKIENSGADTRQVTTVEAVADVADSLDGTYFLLPDKDGTVAFWFDHGDTGTAEPAHGADRSVEITTVSTGDDAETVAAAVAAAIAADSQFSTSVSTTTVTVTDAVGGARTGESAGDSGFTVTVDTAGVEGGVKYTVRDDNTNSVLPDEVYDVAIGSIDSSTFSASQMVDVTVDSTGAEPDLASFTALASGSDGTIADTDYQSAIAKAEVEAAGNVIFLDEYNSIRSGYLKTHVANTQDKMCIIAGPEVQTRAEAVTDVANYRDSEGRIIYAYPWLETVIGGTRTFVSPASFYASILSQTSPHIDPAYTENTQFLAGVTNLKTTLTRSDYILLKDAGVSAFEYDADIGFKVKSGVVTQIANSSKVTVLRRRMADYLTASAARFLKNYQNAVNSAENRSAVKGAFLNFIETQESNGILPRDSEVTSGLAKLVDTESLNTDVTIAAGMFKILWKQRIYSAMRFIVLQAQIGESVVVTDEG